MYYRCSFPCIQVHTLARKKVYTHTHTRTLTHKYICTHTYRHAHTHADTRAHTHMWERRMFTHMQIWKDKFSVLSQKKVRMVSDGHHLAMSFIISGLWKKKLVLQKFLFLWEECGRFSCLRSVTIQTQVRSWCRTWCVWYCWVSPCSVWRCPLVSSVDGDPSASGDSHLPSKVSTLS